LYFARDYQGCIDQANKALAIDPTAEIAGVGLVGCYDLSGKYKQAVDQMAKMWRQDGSDAQANAMLHAFEKNGYNGYLAYTQSMPTLTKITMTRRYFSQSYRTRTPPFAHLRKH